jgi:hypothetical protein
MNWIGIIVGIFTILTIGLFHPIVIKSEYYFGKKIWPVFLVLGTISVYCSLILKDPLQSSMLGVLAFTLFWSIKELFEQEKRVEKELFPKNPKRLI